MCDKPPPGTREVFDGNTRIGITVVNPREFQDYYEGLADIERIRQAWAESWRRRNNE